MNDLIKLVREQFPDDPRSDGQLMMELGQLASTSKPEWLQQFPEFAAQWKQLQRDLRPSAWQEFKGSVGSAVDNLQATTLGAGAMAADLVGADRVKAYLAEQAMEQQRQASEFQPSVGSYTDIEGAGDIGYYTAYALGQVVPSVAESAILALVGAAIGSAAAPGPGSVGGAATGLVAKTALRNLIKAGVKDFASEAGKAALAKEARSVAAGMGAKIGLAVASIPQSQGEIYNSIGGAEGGAGISAAAGTLSGLLDLLPESYVLSRFFKPGKEIAKAEANKALAYVKRLGIEATKTMPMEGSTEAAQEFINWASEKYARNEPASITPADVERFTNAGLIGAVGGAMFAPVSAMGTGREMPAAPTQPTPPAQPTRPVQPVPPVQPPFADSYGEPIGPVSPARASAEAMFAGETDEAGNPISPDRAMRRSDAGAAGLRADLFQQRTQADVAAAPALGEIEDTSGVVTPVDQFFAADANAKGPTEFDYIGKVRAAVQAAQNAERQAQENEAIRIRLEGMAARDNAANVRARQVGLAMMGAAPEPTEFDAMAQATAQPTPDARRGTVLYQGVRAGNADARNGKSTWLTDDINIARHYAEAEGPGGRVDVYDLGDFPSGIELEDLRDAQMGGAYNFAGLSGIKPTDVIPVSIPQATPQITQEPVTPAVAAEPRAAAPEAVTPAPVSISSPSYTLKAPRPLNESLGSVDDILAYRRERIDNYRKVIKSEIGLNDEEADRLIRLLRSGRDTAKFERSLSSEKQRRLEAFFEGPLNQRGGPLEDWVEGSGDINEVATATDKEWLADKVVDSLGRVGQTPELESSDRFLLPVLALKRLSEIGGGWKDVYDRVLRKVARMGAGDDSVELTQAYSKSIKEFADKYGIELPLEQGRGVSASPAPISIPEAAPVSTVPRYTQPGQLAGLTLIRDLRNEPLTTEEKVASVKEIAGKNKTGSAGAVLLLDRGTGTVQLRRVKDSKGKLSIDMAQRRGSDKGVANARRTIDFDAPYEGAQLNKVLGEVLPDQSPRFEILGTALFKSPEAVVNIALGPVANLDTDPEISKFIALGHQAPAEVSERDRTGRRAPASKAVSFDDIENVVSDDPRAGIVTANKPVPEPIMEGSVEDTTAPVDTEAEAMGRGVAAEPEEPVADGTTHRYRKVAYDAGIAIAEGASELQAKKQIANALKKAGYTPAVIEARSSKVKMRTTFENVVDLLYTHAKLVAEEADRLNTIRANSPIRMGETERISLFTRLVQAIRASGGDVVAFQKALEAEAAPWAQAAGFQLTQADGRSLVGLGLNTLTDRDPQAVIALLHETAHHFLNKVITDPALRLRYQDVLDRMHWSQQKWLMNPMSTELRLIANADPATLSEYQKQLLAQLPADQVAKLRATDPTVLLIEQGAEHLAMLGAEKGQARSVLSQIIRLAKDLMLRLAMAYQRTLKGPNAVSDKLVRQFVENRWLQFINQDFAQGPLAISSLRNWIGAPSTAKERIAVYTNVGGGDSRVGELDPQTGEIFPTNFVPEDADQLVDKIANANFTIRRSIDQSIRYAPAVQIDSEFAVINYIDETVGALFSRLQSVLPKAVLENESPSSAFLKKLLMMPEGGHPETMRKALRGEALSKKDMEGKAIPFNERTTISSLVPTTETYTDVDGRLRSIELNSAQDYAVKASLSRLYTISTRVQNDLAKAKERLERFAKRKQLSNKELELQTSLNERAALLERILNDEGVGLKWRIGDLESRIKGATHDIYYAGAEYLVPESSDSAPGKFKTRTLPKDLRFSPALEQEFIANLAAMRHWLDNAENAKYGKEYGRMSHQWNRLSQEFSTSYVYSAVTGNFRKTFLGSLTEHLRAIGTPDAKHAAKSLYRFQENVSRHQNDAKILGARWAEAYQKLIKAMGRRNDESFKDQVWDLMSRTFEQINEGTPNAVEIAQKVFVRYGIEFKSKAENDAFRDLVRATRDGQRWRKDVFESLGLDVEDDALVGPDGKKLQRRLLALGYFNGQRHASKLISSLYLTMSPEWSSTEDKIELNPLAKLGGMLASDPQKAAELIAKAFPSAVINDFVVPLVRNNSEFITFSREEESGEGENWRTRRISDGRASQNSVQLAWERANGDVVAFAKELHKLELRDEVGVDEAQTINDVMHSFLMMYGQIKTDAEARLKTEANGIEVMARQMMDGRQADNWPAEWVSYGRYDDTSNFMFLMQSALNSAFGRNGFGHGGEFAATLGRLRKNIEELQNAERRFREEGMTPEQIRKKMGADQYEIALQAEDHLYALGQMPAKMASITKTTGYLLADMRLLTDIIHAQASMLLQNPRSSILQYFDIFAPLWKTKLSTTSLAAMKQAATSTLSDIGVSVADALGFEVQLNTGNAIRRRNAGIKDPDNYLTWRQKNFAARTRFAEPDRPEHLTERTGRQLAVVVRAGRDLMNFGRNDVMPNSSPKALAPKFRPFGLFSAVSQSVTNGLVDALYSNMSDLAIRGVKLIERTGDSEAYVRGLEGGQIKLDPKDLGYSRKWVIFNDKAAYDYLADALTTKMRERSVEDFIAKAYRRKQAAQGGQWEALDNNQFAAMANIATSEYSLQANVLTTPIDMMTNPFMRMQSVFLVWPWNAMMRSAASFRDAQGRLTKEAMIDGATLLLMGAIPAALAGSLLVDLYDEKVAGKRSNFRDMSATSIIPGVGPILEPMAVLERLARYGTFGLASEAVNGVMNYDDARGGFSADNRIFIFNQIQTVRTLLSNLYRQDGETTYQSVGRPLLQFIGFNGVLQYTQMATRGLNAMGANISTQDLAINERINAGNYLRATGRALDLDVRVMKGLQSLPTPVTPYIQQMELGATVGDYELFREGYAHAIQMAAKEGKEDPVKYVKDAFAQRHPLRRIFRVQPTENEYRQILSSLNEAGRNSVSRVVTSYNSYLERLNLKPVVGKKEKVDALPVRHPSARPAMSLEQARALAAQASFGGSPY